MAKYEYTISYDEQKDDFFGIVDLTDNAGTFCLYTIDSTAEMCELIKTGKMTHIDDVEGLRKYLFDEQYLEPEDTIVLTKKTMF